jgi:hypothetical protein
MTKANAAARKRPMHFEQISVEIVKKVAKEDVATDKKAGRKSTARSVPARALTRNGR